MKKYYTTTENTVNELNANVLAGTFTKLEGDQAADLYHSENECPVLVCAGTCPPVNAEYIETVILSFPEKYIIPTKERPVFIAVNTYFGYIETNMYKMWKVRNNVGCTFAVKFADAVNFLHEWIKENKDIVLENPNCKYYIEVVDGSVKDYGDDYEVIYKKVYEISASKAIKYLI